MIENHYTGEEPLPRGSRLAMLLLHLMRWRFVLCAAPPAKCVVVFYPHTSNWDFVIGLVARAAGGVHCAWAGKDTLFRWPFAALLRRLGGIPVNRRERTGFSEQMAEQFARRDTLALAIAPEGTRKRTAFWHSGFYYAARTARVPLALAFIDYARREIGIGAYLALTGDVGADLERIAAFYADKRGRHPEQQAPIRFRDAEK